MTASEKNGPEICGTSGAGSTNGTTGKSRRTVSVQTGNVERLVASNLKKLITQSKV